MTSNSWATKRADDMLSAILCSALLFAADTAEPLDDPQPEAQEPLVPFYVPRSASLGFFYAINRELVSPHFRLQWEAMFVDQPHNALGWFINFGSGFGANPPAPMTAHFQHAALGGVIFASDRPVFHWGFQIGFGAVWYRSFFLPDTFRPENYALPYVEGRLQAGGRVLPHLRLAVYVGYGSPVYFPPGRKGSLFVGGLDFGVVIDWR